MTDDATIAAAIVACLAARAADASICPSDAARILRADESAWRALMPQVRRVAAGMVESGVIEATQGGRRLPSSDVPLGAGPIRLRRGERFPAQR